MATRVKSPAKSPRKSAATAAATTKSSKAKSTRTAKSASKNASMAESKATAKKGATKSATQTAAKTAAKSATKTATKRAGTKSASTKSAGPKANGHGFHPGTYVVPRGHVSIAVPTFWNLRQTNDDVQVESEASETTVVVSAYHRNEGVKALDARDYLEHFLNTAPVAGGLKSGESSRTHASARFRDEEGDNWVVRFLTNGQTLLLATCHSNRPLNSREGRTGLAVLDSIKLKGRE